MPSIGFGEIFILFAIVAVYVAIPVIVIAVVLRLLGYGKNKPDTR
jgi:hypothetical protein